MSDLAKRVKTSIERIKAFNPLMFSHSDSYFVAFSGGKDSVALKALMDMAGAKYEAHYRITSVDPPELVQFIKEKHPDVHRDYPVYAEYGEGAYRGDEWVGKAITMWNLIPWKLVPPTRIMRYCCDYLKESSGDGRMTVTGVRWAESVNRKKKQGIATVYGKAVQKELSDSPYFRLTGNRGAVLVNDNSESRQMLDACVTRHKTCLNPIVDWTDNDVWEKTYRTASCTIKDGPGLDVSAVQWQIEGAGEKRSPHGRSTRDFISGPLAKCCKRGKRVGTPMQRGG